MNTGVGPLALHLPPLLRRACRLTIENTYLFQLEENRGTIMNKQEPGKRFVPALAVPEGAGVTVYRTIGTPALRNLDPFLLLDYFGSDNPDEYIAGFPSHPHRGFSTFTYMVDGYSEHRDSMGNTGNLGPGPAQLMKAASGIIHSEMPQQENGLLRGFQLWINLPAAHKMDHPEYQEYKAGEFPVIDKYGYRLKLLLGSYESVKAPIKDAITCVQYYDVEVKPGNGFADRLPPGHNAFLYIFEGSGELNGHLLEKHTLVAFTEGDNSIDFVAGNEGARFIVSSGKPIGEPVVQYGPFVMNTWEEINQAMRDFKLDNFVRHKARMRRDKSKGSSDAEI